ncbi:MAG: phosphoglycerate kinase [Candidatus Eisenbacteria bacterium]|uniref:Phosphoglycerate kinase n=1 Tax=Eiseniibacteriota bacterium TaxID=2212470 RepID=A0A948RT13_UNCEI|nr:phosphoglycerate kinase [Candidatus Eisenbacteria bacterium]MBU1948994.1 phosphoglycerate kinase [Candidatus Eisenbacteria bacterium]MBU2689476.1 phosphoglycerate kinase [Candidatus Eisenbacteria bacterium]
MRIKTLAELSIENKDVLVRVDYNVPLKDGKVGDDTRLQASLPTIRRLLGPARRVILMSHLGRPKGKRVPEMSLAPVAKVLEDLLGQPVRFAPDCIGDEVQAILKDPQTPRVVLLENLRYHPEETDNDEGFAAELAQWGSVYVNDAFGAAHRAHASTYAVAKLFKERGMGLLMEREVAALASLLEAPRKPFAAILGGAKISGKVDVVENLLPIAQHILIGGAMAFTFLRARGLKTGLTLVEEDRIAMAGELLEKAEASGVELLLPIDAVLSQSAEKPQAVRTRPVEEIAGNEMAVDIGPKSTDLFRRTIMKAGTIFWNGPMGIFEVEEFSKGTLAVAQALADATGGPLATTTVVGGGDSVAAIKKLGLADAMTHVSTGGGASLEFIGGRELPGVEILEMN